MRGDTYLGRVIKPARGKAGRRVDHAYMRTYACPAVTRGLHEKPLGAGTLASPRNKDMLRGHILYR